MSRMFGSMGTKPTLRRRELAALNAVARHFSATWDLGETPPAAYLQITGKRIALGIATMKVRTETSTKPRLRFDKVALGLVRALQADPGNVVPDDEMVIVTVTAPIRSDSKTTAALRETIRECLTRRARRVEIRQTIHENRTAVRRMKGMPRTTSKVIGFVHNPGPDPGVLLDLTESLAKCIAGAANEAITAKSNGDRWLVIAIESGLPHIETYRHAYSQLGIESKFERIIMVVLAGERVEILKG